MDCGEKKMPQSVLGVEWQLTCPSIEQVSVEALQPTPFRCPSEQAIELTSYYLHRISERIITSDLYCALSNMHTFETIHFLLRSSSVCLEQVTPKERAGQVFFEAKSGSSEQFWRLSQAPPPPQEDAKFDFLWNSHDDCEEHERLQDKDKNSVSHNFQCLRLILLGRKDSWKIECQIYTFHIVSVKNSFQRLGA